MKKHAEKKHDMAMPAKEASKDGKHKAEHKKEHKGHESKKKGK